ncbi:MarR family winged helix-turn-helix transcriptional regulator [Streptomyces sp. NPDC004393]|uniref:MarR family winged helix-turn-helix transcriptional regulator n=1 Tax=Streptomyces sp. NPDC004533 TaxID=3154278 RepID=UPI0033BBF883
MAGHPERPIVEAPLYLLRRALQTYTSIWQTEVRDLTPPQYTVLRSLQEEPDLDQSTLGRRAGIDVATLTPLLDRLESRGFVEREVDPKNRRRKLLRLSKPGARLLDDIHPAVRQAEEHALAGLSPEERDTLTDMLERVARRGAGGAAPSSSTEPETGTRSD